MAMEEQGGIESGDLPGLSKDCQEILEMMPDSLLISDGAGIIRVVNRQTERFFGYSRKELIGRSIEMLIPRRYHAGHAAHLKDYMISPRVRSMSENRKLCGLHKNGREIPVDISLSPLCVNDQTWVFASVRDISQRVRLDAHLRQAQRMESVGRLAGGVAHDFNNMLAVILSSCAFIEKEVGRDHPIRKDIQNIESAAQRAARLTKQLLAFSRKQVLQPRVLDLSDEVSGIVNLIRRLIGENIDLRVSSEPGLWKVKVDPGQVEQICMNLAVNAKGAMSRGGELTFETANVELSEESARARVPAKAGPYVMLAVKDTGHGMDDETKARIFEPFFTTKGKYEGTGLGLATVYGIVKQSGGYIYVYSEKGRGTTFKIYFPKVDEPVAGIVREKPAKMSFRGSETVLVVEDDQVLRGLIGRVLSSNGYTVLDAPDGDAALEAADRRQGDIDLLLTDTVMPGLTAKELAERFGVSYPKAAVIFMSGYTDETIMHHGVLDPGVVFLPKPFTPTLVLKKVRESLDARA